MIDTLKNKLGGGLKIKYTSIREMIAFLPPILRDRGLNVNDDDGVDVLDGLVMELVCASYFII